MGDVLDDEEGALHMEVGMEEGMEEGMEMDEEESPVDLNTITAASLHPDYETPMREDTLRALVPTRPFAQRLVNEYHDKWYVGSDRSIKGVGQWLVSLLKINDDSTQPSCYPDLKKIVAGEKDLWSRICMFASRSGLFDEKGIEYERMQEIFRLLMVVDKYLFHVCLLSQRAGKRGADALGQATLEGEEPTPVDRSGYNSFQQVYFHIIDELSQECYRRSGEWFFERVVTGTGIETFAFKEALEIERFIHEKVNKDVNLAMFLEQTRSGAVYPQLKQELTHPMKTLREAPELEENCHLRSFEGDELGRGSVVYDCYHDMAWPYVLKPKWVAMADKLNEMRLEGERSPPVVPPKASDVCVLHLRGSFPYDIFAERMERTRLPQLRWQFVDDYQADARGEYRNAAVSAYMARCFSGKCRGPDGKYEHAKEGGYWGRTWQPVADTVDVATMVQNGELQLMEVDEVFENDLYGLLSMTKDWFPMTEQYLKEHIAHYGNGLTRECVCLLRQSGYVAPLFFEERRRRFSIPLEEWVEMGGGEAPMPPYRWVDATSFPGHVWEVAADRPPDGRRRTDVDDALLARNRIGDWSYVESRSDLPAEEVVAEEDYVLHGDVVFRPVRTATEKARYRVHYDRMWNECHAPEMDLMYDYQSFGDYDKFFLYGLKGRTFFEVHEVDTYQTTLFIQGTGGCGKSTIMQVVQKFWPAHLRGNLSANVEAKFGMSEVLKKGKAKIILCNEVSEQFQLVQEEWQTSCSGEEGSYAVKNGAPYVGVCKAHHFWVGNQFPKTFKNTHGQVSRRLAGVRMMKRVKHRDGSLGEKLESIMGTILRKMILAYFEFFHKFGPTDPFSLDLCLLPRAFRDFADEARKQIDPWEKFLAEKKNDFLEFEVDVSEPDDAPAFLITFERLNEEFKRWKLDRDPKSGATTLEAASAALQEFEISVLPRGYGCKEEEHGVVVRPQAILKGVRHRDDPPLRVFDERGEDIVVRRGDVF